MSDGRLVRVQFEATEEDGKSVEYALAPCRECQRPHRYARVIRLPNGGFERYRMVRKELAKEDLKVKLGVIVLFLLLCGGALAVNFLVPYGPVVVIGGMMSMFLLAILWPETAESVPGWVHHGVRKVMSLMMSFQAEDEIAAITGVSPRQVGTLEEVYRKKYVVCSESSRVEDHTPQAAA